MGSGTQKRDVKEVAAATGGALQRIAALEGELPRLLEAINANFEKVNQRCALLDEMIAAVINSVGVEEIKVTLDKMRTEAARARSVEAKEALAKAVEKGEWIESPMITEESLITGSEFGVDGQPLDPSYSQITYAALVDSVKEMFLGLAPGASVVTPSGGRFEVGKIYVEAATPEYPSVDDETV